MALEISAGVVGDPVRVENHELTLEYKQQDKKRRNYLFIDGYIRLNIDLNPVHEENLFGSLQSMGLKIRSSENISVYIAQEDTNNLFSDVLLDGVNRRCTILALTDSMWTLLEQNGIWGQGHEDSDGQKYYLGIDLVRLPLRSIASDINISGFTKRGDIEGTITNIRKNILRTRSFRKSINRTDTLENDRTDNFFLHGQKRYIELDSGFVGSNVVGFDMQGADYVRDKIEIIQDTLGAMVIDKSPGGFDLVAWLKDQAGRFLAYFGFSFDAAKYFFRDADDSNFKAVVMGNELLRVHLAEESQLKTDVDENNDKIEITRTSGINVYLPDGTQLFNDGQDVIEKKWKDYVNQIIKQEVIDVELVDEELQILTVRYKPKNSIGNYPEEKGYFVPIRIRNVDFYDQSTTTWNIQDRINYSKIATRGAPIRANIEFSTTQIDGMQIPSDEMIREQHTLALAFVGGLNGVYLDEMCERLVLYDSDKQEQHESVSKLEISEGNMKIIFDPEAYIDANLRRDQAIQFRPRYTFEVAPGRYQSIEDTEELNRVSGYQFGKSVYTSNNSILKRREFLAESKTSMENVYSAGVVNLTFANSDFDEFPDRRMQYPHQASWYMLSGHGLSTGDAGFLFTRNRNAHGREYRIELLGFDAKYDMFHRDIINDSWQNLDVIIFNSCYNLNIKIDDDTYPTDEQLWYEISKLNGLQWFDLINRNGVVLGWGECIINGKMYGSDGRARGMSPADKQWTANGEYVEWTQEMIKRFRESIDSQADITNSMIAKAWVDATNQMINDDDFEMPENKGPARFNAIGIAEENGVVKVWAMDRATEPARVKLVWEKEIP
ncbi:hypothetical protein QA601_18535 [Chitinispirillales bacterium ANBcel5]|uniref:hypothetical protein n=1 Tax=Cellulosispirillum alkaliphilum TaxID=3039283 RepID=UPI002A50CBE8|nr:hypothetical protein [Chitinispirillales bacterium ANBcel5]